MPAAKQMARIAYHRTRKRVLRVDIHERITRVTLRHLARYELADRYVGGRDVLDAASGSGYGAMLLSSARSYRGIDLDARAVASARREFPEFSFDVGSVHELPLAAGAVDAAVSFETLEHVPDPQRAVAEFARVLAPGGVLVASIPINHPDTVYHVRPYSALECWDIATSCAELRPTEVFAQHDRSFDPVAEGAVGDATGTLIVVLERRSSEPDVGAPAPAP